MSITKKKKSLSSPQHSIKEHQDETIDNDNKAEIIDSGKIPVEEVLKEMSKYSHLIFETCSSFRFIQLMIGNMQI